MGRRFIDFWVHVTPENSQEILSKLRELGFGAAVVEFDGSEEEFRETLRYAESMGLELYRKLVVRVSGRRPLLSALRSNRGRYEVISVVCEDLETALVAARDNRVDTVVIPPRPGYRFDKGVASLLRNRVEIPFNQILEDPEPSLKTYLEVFKILGRKAGIIVSSGASSPLMLRTPWQLISLPMIMGYSHEEALKTVSDECWSIIATNLEKLSPDYVAPGVVRIGR